jgi:hypothetical protein
MIMSRLLCLLSLLMLPGAAAGGAAVGYGE